MSIFILVVPWNKMRGLRIWIVFQAPRRKLVFRVSSLPRLLSTADDLRHIGLLYRFAIWIAKSFQYAPRKFCTTSVKRLLASTLNSHLVFRQLLREQHKSDLVSAAFKDWTMTRKVYTLFLSLNYLVHKTRIFLCSICAGSIFKAPIHDAEKATRNILTL